MRRKSERPMEMQDPAPPRDPLSEPLSMRYGPVAFPKHLLRLHLDQLKKGESPIAEQYLLEAIEKVKWMKGDKEVLDILYALTDVSPHQSVRDKAREALR